MEDAAWEAYELPPLSDTPPEDMFTSLDEQLTKVRRWNAMRRWGFTGEDFDAVDLTPRAHSRPLVVDVVAVYLRGTGDLDAVRHTADDLWLMAALEQPNSWCWTTGTGTSRAAGSSRCDWPPASSTSRASAG